MCGLVAVAQRQPLDAASAQMDVTAALEQLAPRGPDGSSLWRSPSGLCALGHTRLAINDPSPAGAQPFVEGPFAAVCNGEIYNAPTLRHELERKGCVFRSRCDCEVVLHAWRVWGWPDFLHRLQGMFALVLWDDVSRTLRAAVDHVGMKPLSLQAGGAQVWAASTLEALRALSPQPPALSADALAWALALGYVPQPRTVYEGCLTLAPGTAVTWRPGKGLQQERWWRPPATVADAEEDPKALDDAFEALLLAVVEEHLLSDEPLALLLSGGLDSTALAAALRDLDAQLACLSVRMPGGHDESAAAAATARALGFEHEVIDIDDWPLERLFDEALRRADSPHTYGSFLAQCRLADAVRRRHKAAIAGDGGDEAFGGYAWALRWAQEQQGVLDAAPGNSVGGRAAVAVAPDRTDVLLSYLRRVRDWYTPAEARALLPACSLESDEAFAAPLLESVELSGPALRAAQRIDLAGLCAGSILPKVDRMSMGVGLEVRAPLLDRRLLAWALAFPVEADAEQPEGAKPLLRRFLARRSLTHVLRRPKQGFSMRVDWSRHTGWLRRRIADSRLVREGLVARTWEAQLDPAHPRALGRLVALAMLCAWADLHEGWAAP